MIVNKREVILFLFMLMNLICYSQGFNVACGGDTIRGNHGGYEYDDSLTFCAYRTQSSPGLLPERILEINDSIISRHFTEFFKNNSVAVRDYLRTENDSFDSMKVNGMGWISMERCAQQVKYAIRYQVWIYGNIRYFFSLNYDSAFNCLNLPAIMQLSTCFNKNTFMDFCSIKAKADQDKRYRGMVTEVTFSIKDSQCIWIVEKAGPPMNKKTLQGYDYILTYHASTGELLTRNKRHYQSCEPCPTHFW